MPCFIATLTQRLWLNHYFDAKKLWFLQKNEYQEWRLDQVMEWGHDCGQMLRELEGLSWSMIKISLRLLFLFLFIYITRLPSMMYNHFEMIISKGVDSRSSALIDSRSVRYCARSCLVSKCYESGETVKTSWATSLLLFVTNSNMLYLVAYEAICAKI